MIIGIVCVDHDWGIGNKGQLLYTIKEDMQFFKKQTTGHAVLMGLTTYYSIGKPLPNRRNVVLCPEGTEIEENVEQVHSLDEALEFIKNVNEDVYIIGGASVYKLFLPYYDRVYVTKVPDSAEEKDTFFPNLDADKSFMSHVVAVFEWNEHFVPVYLYERRDAALG